VSDTLAGALAELQASPPRIRKSRAGQHSKYADLPSVTAALRPALVKLGLLWTTIPTVDLQGQFVLRWSLTHLPSGESMSGDYPIRAEDPQRVGSEITYARRYALVTVTGVTPEGDDDDGAAASAAGPSRPARTRTRVPGPEHERLRQGTAQGRADIPRAVEWEDPWEGQPAGTLPKSPTEPEDYPGSIDGRQRTLIMMHMKGYSRDDRLAALSSSAGREVESVNDLSMAEAAAIIKRGGWS
jgi:ERF superfamily